MALVGETGAGKSTVVKLLARFYDPTAGAVLVDGSDLRAYDLSAYRRRLGYVPQEGFLFTGSIRDNIAYGRPDTSDDEVQAAAVSVGADQFIAHLANGYETAVSERGRSLSAGQRQLVALARAELVDPTILLLDEATSNLDLAAEAHVASATDRVARGRTTVVIAHRLQTARMADRIIVLVNGASPKQGTPRRRFSRRVGVTPRCGEHPILVSSVPEHAARLGRCRLPRQQPGLGPGVPGHGRRPPGLGRRVPGQARLRSRA